MMIDSESIRNLELVGNTSHRKSVHSLYGCALITHNPLIAATEELQRSKPHIYTNGSSAFENEYFGSCYDNNHHRC